ncbi:MAG: translation initiation factor IF-3 [Candidatus Peregrinibacteria bacterium]|nr:translation initiation factor IF-3 [Candidatus Peregrinibacteria bacterium]
MLFLYKKYIAKDLRINRAIRSPSIRLIGNEGEQLGIIALEKALEMAREQELDLAEVAPNAKPPVCKILDYGKYLYHQKKVDTKHKKMQKKAEIKGVRLGFKTGDHDIETKAKQARGFLAEGNSVKVTLIFRGRESMYKDLATDKLRKFYESLKDVANVDMSPKNQGNMLIMILTPNKS